MVWIIWVQHRRFNLIALMQCSINVLRNCMRKYDACVVQMEYLFQSRFRVRIRVFNLACHVIYFSRYFEFTSELSTPNMSLARSGQQKCAGKLQVIVRIINAPFNTRSCLPMSYVTIFRPINKRLSGPLKSQFQIGLTVLK